MKIFILRHEDRTQDATFFSPLTSTGIENSERLIDILKKHKINKIYTSPFIRTLQTIHPYASKYCLKLNLEYSLCEIQHPHIIPEKSYQVRLPTYMAKSFNYNEKYKSIFDPIDYHYHSEENIDVSNRIKNFLNSLINNKITKQDNILLVTHQVVCNEILKIATKNLKDVEVSSSFNYPEAH